MWVAVFIVTTAICAVGWLTRYISCAAVVYYMKMKEYKLPNNEEMEECTQFVTRHLFRQS